MIRLLSIITIFFPLIAGAVEIPDKPNGRTSLSIAMFGTTENPANPPYFKLFAYEMRDDALLTSQIKDNKNGTDLKKRISKDEYAAIYKIFWEFFNKHKLSADPNIVKDGSSMELKLSVGSESVTATFAHDSFRKSQDIKRLVNVLEKAHAGSTQNLLTQFK